MEQTTIGEKDIVLQAGNCQFGPMLNVLYGGLKNLLTGKGAAVQLQIPQQPAGCGAIDLPFTAC